MSELQSFFAPADQSQTRDDLPDSVSTAARDGDVHTVRRWLAAGGSPDASRRWSEGNIIYTNALIEDACASSRPSNTEIVDLLLAAGVNLEGPRGEAIQFWRTDRDP